MERKIGEKFTFEGNVLHVVENDSDDIAYFKRGVVACNQRCVFCFRSHCTGVLSVTGDCQKRFRKDKQHVFFEDAAFAHSPFEAAAANSPKILRKS